MRLGDEFAINLFRHATKDCNTNFVASPIGIFVLLCLLREGSTGIGRAELTSTLGLERLSDEVVHQTVKQIIGEFNSRDGSILRVANALWMRLGVSPTEAMLRCAADVYSSKIAEMDFEKPTARKRINDWVTDATNGEIQEIVNAISRSDFLYLTNAVYFNAKWFQPFAKSDTKTQIFHCADGSEKPSPFMRKDVQDLFYRETDYHQAVVLPFAGWRGGHSMFVLLPRLGTSVTELAAQLTPGDLEISNFEKTRGTLALPKFQISSNVDIIQPLKSMKLEEIFRSGNETLLPLCTNAPEPPVITGIQHNSILKIDEDGCIAASATAMRATMAGFLPVANFEMIVDRPFILSICESTNHKLRILFMAQVGNPS
jgi:serine protease inhibitor